MKRFLSAFTLIVLLFIGISCSNKEDNSVPSDLQIQNFVWKGLNAFYFWQQDVPNLADNRFSSQDQLNAYLSGYAQPDELFYSLLNNYPVTDRFSWIVDDYVALEQLLQQGISGTTGVEFGLTYETGSNVNVYGYVKYIIPGSDASTKNIQRGAIFDAVNGIQLTVDNYRSLLFSSTVSGYTLNFASYNGGNPISNGLSVDLIKTQVQENPVLITKTITVPGHKIGYLMYNSFTSAFDNELNAAFGTLKSSGITDLVLDLRYNPGGSVRTATYLAQMVTGQFTGQLFTKEHWNNKWQSYFEGSDPSFLINNFVNQLSNGNVINSLNLTSVVILTTNGTASASELIINGLNPYINVTTIGTKTVGKHVASLTLYDSNDYGRQGANPNHTWAMQPIVLEELNKLNQNNPLGFDPTILFPEDKANLGILGDVTEPLLQRAISFIVTGNRINTNRSFNDFQKELTNSKRESLTGTNMYVDKKLNKLF